MKWKAIPGYDNYYEASESGQVRTWKNGRWGRRDKPFIMKQRKNRYGYYVIKLQKDDVRSLYKTHRLVAKLFLKHVKGKTHVNHKDCDKTNNHYSNLEWCTLAENIKHASENGLMPRGEKNYHAVLKRNDVLQIRSILEQGFATKKELAIAYDISLPTIYDIESRRSWAHI